MSDQSANDQTQDSGRPMPDEKVYVGLLGDITRELAKTTEADPVAILVTLMAGFGVLIGNRPHVQIHDDAHPLLIWPMVLGHTSIGRKGMSLGVARSVLRETDPEFSQCVTSGLSSGEGLITAVADTEEEVGGKRRLIIETEYAVTMARAGREGNTLGGVLRQAWEGDSLSTLTKATVKATSPHIGILAHITPGEFRARVKGTEMAGGTYNRYLPTYSERMQVLPEGEGAGHEVISRLGFQLGQRVTAARSVGKVGMTPNAASYWREVVYLALSSGVEVGAVGQFTARAAPYARRIAALYALASGETVVGREHLEAAYHLVNYSRTSAAHALGATTTGDPEVDKAYAELMKAGEAGLTRTQFSGVFHGHMKAQRLTDVLKAVTALPGVSAAPEKKAVGRPAWVWSYSEAEAKEAKEAKEAR